MSARILVTSGPEAGTTFPIEEEVSRIGSRSDCDLRLTGVRPNSHLITLRFKDGNYTVANRSPSTVTIGGRPLASEGSSSWKNGETLQIEPNVVMRLAIEGDPAPTKVWAPEINFDQTDREYKEKTGTDAASTDQAAKADDSSGKKGMGTVIELAAIALCVVLFPLILMFGSNGSTVRDEETVRTDFEKLTRDLDNAVQQRTNAGWNSYLLGQLQAARAFELRDDRLNAESHYRRLRDQLTDREARTDLEKRVLEFTLFQLRELDQKL